MFQARHEGRSVKCATPSILNYLILRLALVCYTLLQWLTAQPMIQLTPPLANSCGGNRGFDYARGASDEAERPLWRAMDSGGKGAWAVTGSSSRKQRRRRRSQCPTSRGAATLITVLYNERPSNTLLTGGSRLKPRCSCRGCSDRQRHTLGRDYHLCLCLENSWSLKICWK